MKKSFTIVIELAPDLPTLEANMREAIVADLKVDRT